MSLAVKYAMKKRMAKGGMACGDCAKGQCMAHGGEVKSDSSDFSDDMVERIMKHRFGSAESADEMPADFDVMDQIEVPTDADYTGANSGDEIGNGPLEEDEDIVSRAMRKRAS